MNKAEMIAAVAAKTGLPRKVTAAVVEATFATLTAGLAEGEAVRLPGFGTLGVRARPARTARDPRTGETLTVAARTVPYFRPAKALREQL